MSRILEAGRTCAVTLTAPHSGVLIDGCDYYRELYRAAVAAERSILIAGWQLDSHVHLLRGSEAEGAPYPVQLVPFLVALCEARPELEVHVLAWNASALFVFEREPLQSLVFNGAHARIHFRHDAVHPVSASHHQKLVVVDRAVAFVGGMDVCESRWDDHCHRGEDPRRKNALGLGYGPYHEAQAYVTGAAVDVLRGWFAERWQRATGEALALPEVAPAELAITPTVAVSAERIGLARTQPPMEEPPIAAIEESRALYVAAIAAARRSIYLENQYYTAEAVQRALLERLAERTDAPLELVLVLPEKAEALKERIALGLRQATLLRELADAARAGGHHLGLYYAVDCGERGDTSVYIHSKLLTVDDRFLLVTSANTTNRSMGLDTELGIAWESPHAEPSIRAVRLALLREHTGLTGADAEAALGEQTGLVARLDRLADDARGRLRRLSVANDLIDRLLPGDVALDPTHPVFEEAMWQAAEGDDTRWTERVAAAWRHLRESLARPAS